MSYSMKSTAGTFQLFFWLVHSLFYEDLILNSAQKHYNGRLTFNLNNRS